LETPWWREKATLALMTLLCSRLYFDKKRLPFRKGKKEDKNKKKKAGGAQ
jgi:hypothetical protein